MTTEEAKIIHDVPNVERNWGVFSHLCAFVLLVPFANLIGPLLIWKLNKESLFIRENAVEALNFQITVIICTAVSGLLCFILIGYLLAPLVALASLVFSVIAALRAAEKEIYRYPYSFRFVQVGDDQPRNA